MEAEIYGMIPSAKIEAFEKEPPANVSNKPSKPDLALCKSSLFGSIPGRATWAPKRYTRISKRVTPIFDFRSSMLQMFLSV
jgi:hypothetical protein